LKVIHPIRSGSVSSPDNVKEVSKLETTMDKIKESLDSARSGSHVRNLLVELKVLGSIF